MQGVKLVRTPAMNSSGSAVAGLPEKRWARCVKFTGGNYTRCAPYHVHAAAFFRSVAGIRWSGLCVMGVSFLGSGKPTSQEHSHRGTAIHLRNEGAAQGSSAFAHHSRRHLAVVLSGREDWCRRTQRRRQVFVAPHHGGG